MLGPEGAGDRVTAWLTARLPARLRALELALGLEAGSLPNPALVAGHDTGPLGLEDWPAVIVLPGRLEGLTLVDHATDGAEVYRSAYAIEVLGWLRADDYKTTDDLRKRYVLAIREALLERKQLATRQAYGAPAPADAGTFAVDPESIREDYGPVVTDEARRTIAGVRLDVTVTVVEELGAPAPMGTVTTATVTATPQALGDPVENVVLHPGLM